MPIHLQIPRHLYDAMIAQARAELPNECCGLLAGHIFAVEGPRRVVQLYPLVNATASPVEYTSDARSMFDAVRSMQKLGLELLAIYHSHPTSEPIPSRTDLARKYSEEVINFIISLQSEPPRVRGWTLTAESYHEASWEVVPD
jgi:[CysO sulfur-carrier protein]-S-L-cysteine hydrolase